MIAYASRTGTRVNLAVLRKAGWRLLVSATGRLRTEGFQYAIDNGAWTAHQKGEPFDFEAFERVVNRLGAGADFIVAPDVVGDRETTLDLAREWLPRLSSFPRVLLAAQDGMTPADVDEFKPYGLFLGGSTEWKLRTCLAWGSYCRERGLYFHVARVNSKKRIRLCHDAGAASFDGTSVTRYHVRIKRLDPAVRQGSLLSGVERDWK